MFGWLLKSYAPYLAIVGEEGRRQAEELWKDHDLGKDHEVL